MVRLRFVRRLVAAVGLAIPLLTALGCAPPVTEDTCRQVKTGEKRDAVEDELGRDQDDNEAGDPHVARYGACSKNHVGLCCVEYDGDVVLDHFWTNGCTCGNG